MFEVQGLRKSYGDVVAVDGISFRAEPGAIFGLLGRRTGPASRRPSAASRGPSVPEPVASRFWGTTSCWTGARRAPSWESATATGGRLETLGTSPAMRAVAQQVAGLAQSDRTTVLVVGEPGVGKGWAARLIHDLGFRAGEPFLEVACPGAESTTLEAQLLGAERGALPGVERRSRGLFEVASRGTLLLREISAMPIELQPVLLRAIESRTFRRVGGHRDVPAHARLVATSSRDLAAEVEADQFRGDLYYRLSTMVLAIPAVRDRERMIGDRLQKIAACEGRLIKRQSRANSALDRLRAER